MCLFVVVFRVCICKYIFSAEYDTFTRLGCLSSSELDSKMKYKLIIVATVSDRMNMVFEYLLFIVVSVYRSFLKIIIYVFVFMGKGISR